MIHWYILAKNIIDDEVLNAVLGGGYFRSVIKIMNKTGFKPNNAVVFGWAINLRKEDILTKLIYDFALEILFGIIKELDVEWLDWFIYFSRLNPPSCQPSKIFFI